MQKFNSPGDIHFVTFKTFQNRPIFKDEKCCELFLANCEFYRQKYDLKIYGYVILYDHVHQLIGFDMRRFPELTISKVIQGIKGASARQIIDYFKTAGSQEPLLLAQDNSMEQRLHATPRHNRGLKFRIWQPGFYDFNIYTNKKFWQKLDYIHKNPLKHKLTRDIAQYKYCSLRNYELNDHSIFKIDYLET